MTTQHHAGGVIALTAPDYDGTWEARQVESPNFLPPGDADGRKSIDWSYGPFKDVGYVNVETWEIGVNVSVVGHSLGNVYGSLKDSVTLNINLLSAKGSQKFYLKNGNEVWTRIDLKIIFNGHYEGDYKILTI